MTKWRWETATCVNCRQSVRKLIDNPSATWVHNDGMQKCTIYTIATPGETRGVST